MATYLGGAKVEGGYYLNMKSWGVEVIPSEGGRLKAPADVAYAKVPFPVVFAIAPVAGAVFVMALPVVGFALVGAALVRKALGGMKESAADLAATVQPGGFAAGEAHFAGKPGEEKKPGAAAPSPELEKLESEIADRKGEKK